MALDLAQVAPQLARLLPPLHRAAAEQAQQVEAARRVLRGEAMPWEALSARLEARRDLLSFTLPAGLLEDPARSYPLPARPEDYCVLATDGSQIELDRHAPLPCYLINLGQVVLRYGREPRARFTSQPRLLLAHPWQEPEAEGNEGAMEQGDRVQVDLERQVAEVQGLRALVQEEAAPGFTLALLDGSLILWTAPSGRWQQEAEPYLRDYVSGLEALRQLARGRLLAVASYISRPGGAEVVNALRAAFCSPDRSYCQGHCRGRQEQPRPCDVLGRLLDRDLFASLQEGERSAIFASRPRVMERYLPPENRVHFFYLNAGPEIGRVEVPGWVAQDPHLLDLTHAAVYDQCRRNLGYPVALMEAHEGAVVTEGDRRAFWEMVYQRLTDAALPTAESAKSRSKRVPWS